MINVDGVIIEQIYCIDTNKCAYYFEQNHFLANQSWYIFPLSTRHSNEPQKNVTSEFPLISAVQM